MVIRYFDKDGKEHRLNIKTNQPVFISSEIGNTGESVEFRIDEHTEFNHDLRKYTTCGKFNIRTASIQRMTILPIADGDIRIGQDDRF